MPQIYTTFYCRINEPSYIKFLKLDILAAIADETNAYDIATELTEYVNDIDEKLARKAIRTVGKIALEVSYLCIPTPIRVKSLPQTCNVYHNTACLAYVLCMSCWQPYICTDIQKLHIGFNGWCTQNS